MSDNLVSALIAATVSIIVGLIGYAATVRTAAHERRKLERELTRRFTERLYDLRVKHYARAFEITERLGKHGAMAVDVQPLYKEIRAQLREWRSGEVSLCISEHSLERLHDLLDAIKKNPEKGTAYSVEQLRKVWFARRRFRGALRVDLGLLFVEEKSRVSSRDDDQPEA